MSLLGLISAKFTFIFYLIGTTLLCALLNGSYRFYEYYYDNPPVKTSYEYIIVGTGTAGSIIAAGIPSRDVLVVEAGSMRTSLMDVPLFQPLLQGTQYDWQYQTEPQRNACRALEGQRSNWPMGKVFGGTHMLNNMIHFDMMGNTDFSGWFETPELTRKFLDYFHRWGRDPTIPVERLQYGTEFGEDFVDSMQAQTKCIEREKFCEKMEELYSRLFAKPNVTARNGMRRTASHYYWEQRRPGHELLLNAHVLKINVENGKAIGLVLEKSNRTYEIRASKGIILSAGTVGSPKILLHSGIGPQKHLKAVRIPLVQNLPVGENLQDHITTGMDLLLWPEKLPLRPLDLISPLNLWNFFNGKNSSLLLPGCEGLGGMLLPDLPRGLILGLGFMVMPAGIASDGGAHLHKLLNLREKVYTQYFQRILEQSLQSVSILPVLLQPKSRGHIRLRDANPHSPPLIDPNYLQHPEDLDNLVLGINIVKEYLEEMNSKKAELNPLPFPGCRKFTFDTKPYWECYVQSLTLTMYHPVGTCRMGPKRSKKAVVSNRDLAVHGVSGLYVVDGSAIPKLPTGNPNSAIAALAHYFLKVKFNVDLLGM